MRRARLLLALGIWIAVLPYLGFPFVWKNVLFTITGLTLVYYSYILYREYKIAKGTTTFDNFSENRNFKKIDTLKETDDTVDEYGQRN